MSIARAQMHLEQRLDIHFLGEEPRDLAERRVLLGAFGERALGPARGGDLGDADADAAGTSFG